MRTAAKRLKDRNQSQLTAASVKVELAGRQGFEFGETCFSKLVMARNFWS
jgi:hypothetical protein